MRLWFAPQIAERALKAGKHVLQEKPIAPHVAAARAALSSYRANPGLPVWALAENYR
jgi:predicted dehydrogenase